MLVHIICVPVHILRVLVHMLCVFYLCLFIFYACLFIFNCVCILVALISVHLGHGVIKRSGEASSHEK